MRHLVLASTSPYRQQLLRQLQLPFSTCAPRFVEEIDPAVEPALTVRHLALGKAQSLAAAYPDALIIGSDQLFTDPRGRMLGKPGTVAQAVLQLQQMRGRTHSFYTGIAVVDSATGEQLVDHSEFRVTLRDLGDDEIQRYVDREMPLDCAGSFKIEGLGIALMEKMEGEDYTSLIGLPLIRLAEMLRQFGVSAI